MPDLTVYVNGPAASDVKVFVEWDGIPYRIGLLQHFSVEVSTDTFLPKVTMSLPCLNLFDEEPPEIADSTIRIVLKDAVSRLEGLEARVQAGCSVFLGNEPVALLNRVFLDVTAGAPKHYLQLRFAKGAADNEEWKRRWDSRIDEIPEWVDVDGGIARADTSVQSAARIVKFGKEGTKLEWENTEYDENPKEDPKEDE